MDVIPKVADYYDCQVSKIVRSLVLHHPPVGHGKGREERPGDGWEQK